MVAVGENLQAIVTQISAFLAAARTQAAVGMTWQKFGELLVQLLHQAVTNLDAISGLTGPEKKVLVLTVTNPLPQIATAEDLFRVSPVVIPKAPPAPDARDAIDSLLEVRDRLAATEALDEDSAKAVDILWLDLLHGSKK